MKQSLDELLLIHSDFHAAAIEMSVQLSIWEKKNEKENTEQRARIDKLQKGADAFETMVGFCVSLWRKNLHLQQDNLEMGLRIKEMEKELSILKEMLASE